MCATHRPIDPADLPSRIPPGVTAGMNREEFYSSHPPDQFVASLRQRRSRHYHMTLLWGGGGVAAATAAVLAFVFFSGPANHVAVPVDGPQSRTQPFGVAGKQRIKGPERAVDGDLQTGQPALYPEVLRHREFQPVGQGQELHANDVLRFYYDSSNYDYLYLFSIDAGGRIHTFYPQEKGYSVPIVRGHRIPLPEGIQLDEYVGNERFFALFSENPLGYWEIEVAVRIASMRLVAAGAGLEQMSSLPLDCHQETLLVEKR